MKGVCLGLGLLLVATFAPTARADEPPKDAAGSVRPAPDVVLLQNGGLLRGTISELVPNDYVILVTVTGEQRKLSMSEVKYAGPESGMPREQQPAAAEARSVSPPTPHKSEVKPMTTIHAAEARVKFAGEQGLVFHRRSSSASRIGSHGTAGAEGFDELCAVPCEVSLPAGSHVLALSKGVEAPATSDEPVAIPAGRSVIQGTYRDRTALRTGLIIAGIAAAGAGLYLTMTSTEEVEKCDSYGCDTTSELDTTKFSVGAALSGLGFASILISLYVSDSAGFSVAPDRSASHRPSSTARTDPKRRGLPTGLIVSARF